MRARAAAIAALFLAAGCATGPFEGIEQAGTLAGAPAWRLHAEDGPSPHAARLAQALGAGGWPAAAEKGPASLVILSAMEIPEGTGAHVAGPAGASWLVRPERRGPLAPRRHRARVSLVVLGPDGQRLAEASAWERVRPDRAAAAHAALVARAAAALLALRPPGATPPPGPSAPS